MFRRVATLVVFVPVIAGPVVAAPVLTLSSSATAKPIRPIMVDTAVDDELPLADNLRQVRATRATGAVGDLLASVRHVGLKKFTMLGVTWVDRRGVASVSVKISVHSKGLWTNWIVADPTDVSPDHTMGRNGTDPIWVGNADGVSVRVVRAGKGTVPTGIKVTTIDPGSSPADSSTVPNSTAAAAMSRPGIVTRAGWGADESMMNWDHEYSKSVKVVFVHHTASSNTYSKSQAAAQVRGIYAYHSQSLGWGDIGYNFLVDRFGTIYEGRSGGIDTAVIGGHTYGFNSETSGVGLIGDFSATVPSSAMLSSLQRITAWKLSRYYRNPQSTQPLTAGISQQSGTGRSFVAGRQYAFSVISGHRDAYSTECPGNQVYGRLGSIRSAVANLMGPRLYDPVATPIPGSTNLPGGVSVSAHLSGTLSWAVTIKDLTTGLVVQNVSGKNTNVMKSDWTLPTGLLKAVLPGTYEITLSATDGRTSAVPATFILALTGAQGGTLYPAGTFLHNGSNYWRVEQKLDGSIQRRPILPSAIQTYPTASSQAVALAGEVLGAIPVGPTLGWAEGTVVNALHDSKYYVVSQGKLRLIPADPGLPGWNYSPDQVLVVPGAEVDKLVIGATMTEQTHPVGTYVRATDNEVYVVLADAFGHLVRRHVVSDLALRSWVAPKSVVTATSDDLALPLDSWERGIADGTVLRLNDGVQQQVVSLGVARRVSDAVAGAMRLRPAASASYFNDLGHPSGQTAPIDGVEIATHPAIATAVTANPNGVMRAVTWQATFYGTPADAVAADPPRP